MSDVFNRTFPITDVSIRADENGERRIVDAYASVFDTPYEVRDWDGHYWEVMRKGAFAKTIREHKAKKYKRLKVLFNHGTDIYGWPSDRFAMPVGRPLDVREDNTGLWTSTRYGSSELAREVLQHIEDEEIDSMSFQGRFLQSKTTQPKEKNDLPTIERLESTLREYGACVFPANPEANILGVRMVAERLQSLNPEQLEQLLTQIRGEAPPTSDDDPPSDGPDPARHQAPPAAGPDLWAMERELELLRLART